MAASAVERSGLSRGFKASVVAIAFFSVLISGCEVTKMAAKAMEPEEATFADPETVMLRGIEEASFRAEYWDESEQAIKVKRWTVRPPFWIVNEALLNKHKAVKEAAQ